VKYLIAGLGNIGDEYANTRHNIGFSVADALAGDSKFTQDRHAFVTQVKFKGRIFVIIKPTTYMNLSGKAVQYWLQAEKIPLENLMVITDDIALPFGTIRIKQKGSDGGHNGLKSIQEILGTGDYPRLRFGVGNEFSKGKQSDYVLGKWNADESKALEERIAKCCEAVKAFATIGIGLTMTNYNGK
jgi:peptidyl-tRNA hydrolase, PTH1 family